MSPCAAGNLCKHPELPLKEGMNKKCPDCGHLVHDPCGVEDEEGDLHSRTVCAKCWEKRTPAKIPAQGKATRKFDRLSPSFIVTTASHGEIDIMEPHPSVGFDWQAPPSNAKARCWKAFGRLKSDPKIAVCNICGTQIKSCFNKDTGKNQGTMALHNHLSKDHAEINDVLEHESKKVRSGDLQKGQSTIQFARAANSASIATATASSRAESLSLSFTATADLYDEFLDQARVPEVAWKHYGGRFKFSGTAVTVKCFEDNSRIKELVATPAPSPGASIVVVDAGGSARCAVLGDLLAKHAARHHWAGLVIYGCVRDTSILRTITTLGIVATGSTPRKSTRRGEGQVNLPVTIGNVTIQPNDRVFVDEDGVLVLGPSESERTEDQRDNLAMEGQAVSENPWI